MLNHLKPGKKLTVVILFSVFLLSLINVIFATWLSSRWALWADEWDNLSPVFLIWKSKIAKDFWWQLGQFNANPPGDNFILRLYYHLSSFSWLKNITPELFWRIPYILTYSVGIAVSFGLTVLWTSSFFVGFIVFILMISSNSLFAFSGEARFYTTQVCFFSASLFLFLIWIEKRFDLKTLACLSITIAWGICHHVLLASLAYLLLVFGLGVVAYSFMKKKKKLQGKEWKVFREEFYILVLSAIPFALYKVALKHWLFIPPSKSFSEMGGIVSVFLQLPWIQFKDWMLASLPNFIGVSLFTFLLFFTLFVCLHAFYKKNFLRFLQGSLIIATWVVTPVVLFISSTARNYGLMGRHFLFTIPIVASAVAYCFIFIDQFFDPFLKKIKPKYLQALMATSVFALFWINIGIIQTRAEVWKDASPSKENYPVVQFREFYKHLPDKRQLVLVGIQPDRYANGSDQGTFTAGMFSTEIYAFRPIFLSKHGSFNMVEKKSAIVGQEILKSPAQYDFLLIDSLEGNKKLFPMLPWSKLKCSTFTPARLTFCRL